MRYYAWLVWVLAATFYAYEFFIRITPNVMSQTLMRSFAVDAVVLSNLSVFYYYAYASMQVPVGLVLDRFGVRYALSFAAFMVSIGCYLFATTTHIAVAEFSRILMGVGSAFAFVGCLKLGGNWFPPQRFAMIVGLTNMLGVLGAVAGEGPLALVVKWLGWRETIYVAAFVGAALFGLILLIVRDKPKEPIGEQEKEVELNWQNVGKACLRLLKSRQTWLVSLYAGLMVAPISAFAELWSVQFLKQELHVVRAEAATLSSVIFVGIAIGGPLNGWFSGFIKKRKPVMFAGVVGAFLSLIFILFLHTSSVWLTGVMLFFFGFFSSSMLMAFAINVEINAVLISGVVVGFTNMLVMAGGSVFQPFTSFILDKYWGGIYEKGARVFSMHDYHFALGTLLFCQILAFVLLFFIKETCCRHCEEC